MLNVQIANVFDAFQRKQYNEALKLSNATLQRIPQNSTLLSLKALTLFYLNRKKEAYELACQCRTLSELDPLSDTRLQLVFKLLNKLEEYSLIPELKYQRQSTEKNGKNLFISYAEAELYQKQAQVCLYHQFS